MNIFSIFGSVFKVVGTGVSGLVSGVSGLFGGMQVSLIQIIGMILGFIFLAGMIFGLIHLHDSNIAQLALTKSTEKQQDIIINELKEQNEKLDILNKFQLKLQKSLDEEKLSLAVRDADFAKYIKSPNVLKSNKAASEIFKETIRKLQE